MKPPSNFKNYFNPSPSKKLYFVILCVSVPLWLNSFSMAQNKPCLYNEKTLQFDGTPVEQARCLLRPNKIGGVLSERLKKLPKPLEKLVGEKVKIKKEHLRLFLRKHDVSENDLGGSLDESLARTRLPNGAETPTLYFVIHDTSSPYLKDEPFPSDFNLDEKWRGNNLEIWLKQPVAHVFVNRLGASITTTPFAETVKKGWGTKFARDFLKADGKGLQLHIELVQPRRRDAAHPNPNNDRFAPFPGFTDRQYERLALLYAAASARRGSWLVPAYHSAIDAGIKDAHDDPQNFELEKFADEIARLLKAIG